MTTTPSAPVALFVFNRPEHARRGLQALAANPEFESSPLHIFCDGARHVGEADAVEAARRVAREWPHPDKHVHEAPANRGLAGSIIGGITALCRSHGRVIAIEDDLLVSPYFLHYMNSALDRYADDERVMHVTGYMWPVALPTDRETVLLPFMASLGWATWDRAWRHFDADMRGYPALKRNRAARSRFDLHGSYPYFSLLERQRAGKVDSWAIRWYLSVFEAGGLALFPTRTQIVNTGFDGSGTHQARDAAAPEAMLRPAFEALSNAPFPADTEVDDPSFAAVRKYLRGQSSPMVRIGRRVRNWMTR